VSVLLLAAVSPASAAVLAYEGFDPTSAPADGAVITGVAGATSVGFDLGSSWSNFSSGASADSTYVASGLTFSTMNVVGGALRQVSDPSGSPRANASRPLDVGATGTIYGSYLARPTIDPADQQDLTGVSVAGVSSYGNGTDAIDDVSHFQVNMEMYVGGGDWGGGTINGDGSPTGRFYNNTTAGTSDVELSEDTTYLVLFKMENLSTLSVDVSQTLTEWILTEAQYANFLADGSLTDVELNAASEGSGATSVLQRGTITKTTDATFSSTDFLLVNSAFEVNTIVDELRISNFSLGEAVGLSTIPEPSTALLAVFGMLVIGIRRRLQQP